MKKSTHAAFLGIVRHLAPETPAGLNLPSHHARKPAETDGMNRFRPFQNGRTGLFKESRHVMRRFIHRGMPCKEFIADGEETHLTLHLTPHHFFNQPEFLHPFDLNAGAITNRDIDILPNSPDTAFHLHGRA